MALDTPSVTQLSQVIAQVTAPSFLLGAVAAFISVLIARINRIIDRSQGLNAISDDDVSRASLEADIPRLKRRAMILNRAILYATVSGIVTSLLVIVAFVCAFFNLQHEYGVAVLFVVALGFFLHNGADRASARRPNRIVRDGPLQIGHRRMRLMSHIGTHATCRDEVLRSAFGGKPENIFSF